MRLQLFKFYCIIKIAKVFKNATKGIFYVQIIARAIVIGGFMQNKLYNTIKKYVKAKPIRFHMPGHNGYNININTSYDITELSFSDNLIESKDVILNVERNIATAYHTNYSLMLTNGATSGVAIALHTAKNFGNKLLLVSAQHKSVHNYANIFSFDITYTESLQNINLNDFDIVVINTPNYFGEVLIDINQLKDCKPLVIWDASHCSHFAFNSKFPKLPTDIADITILSFHKTLPVLTGGAGIVCNDQNIYNHLCYSRSMLHSSSPSYLTMISIDNAICNYSQNGEKLYDKVFTELKLFKHKLNKSKYKYIVTTDFTRLCICTNGISAKKISEQLEEENIYLELAQKDILVAIITPYNYKHLIRYAKALNNITCTEKYEDFYKEKLSKIDTKCKSIEFLDLKDCSNRISASNIGIYPPGTPIITIGDLLDESVINYLANTEYEIFGLTNGKVPVFKTE